MNKMNINYDELMLDISNKLNTINQNEIVEFTNYIIKVLKIDINSETFNQKFNKYFDNWKFRDMQLNLKNFYLPIEETVFNLIYNDIKSVNDKSKIYFSPKLKEIFSILTNFKNNPNIINFLVNPEHCLNMNYLKLFIQTISELIGEFKKNYDDHYIYEIDNFYKAVVYKFKYLYKFIIKLDFVIENDEIIEKENKKIVLDKNELKNFVEETLKIANALKKSIIYKLNSILII